MDDVKKPVFRIHSDKQINDHILEHILTKAKNDPKFIKNLQKRVNNIKSQPFIPQNRISSSLLEESEQLLKHFKTVIKHLINII